jgi:hypothetical protein
MVDKRTRNLLLLAILIIAFLYRFALTTLNIFPPGADIGLHESVIKSITAPKTSFFYNYYHMGGGLSATNPGYHIFAAFIITMTGAPDYVVQAAVASLFSALLIACAFLIVRQVWGELTGFIVAVLVTFSASDIVMLNWAGYPNIVALALIPIIFYFFLQPKKLSSKSYIIAVSIIISALFLTHIFSGLVFLAITIVTLSFSAILHKKTDFTVKKAIYWLAPIALGVLLVSPYLVNIIPVYFGSQGAITGTVAVMKQAVVETRTIPITIFCLSVIPIFLFLVFSKYQKGKVFSLPAILFASWILVPLVATQSYLFSVFLDYERFLYFMALPTIVCIGIIIANTPNALSRASHFLRQSRNLKTTRKLPAWSRTGLLTVLIIASLFTPLFALPNVGASQANFFQVMNPPEYEAIQWIHTNTPENSVIVADAEFGWWLSGFAQRPTLSAVDPQYLILQREFEPARVASNLLKADYLVDNGFLQVEQADSFANGSSHDVYAVLNNSYVHPLVFSINDTQISLLFRNNGSPQESNLGAFTNSSTHVINSISNSSFIITRENQLFSLTEKITIFKGTRFAEISFVLQSKESVNFDWLQLPFKARGFPIQFANSVGIVDNTLHEVNQIVFPDAQLGSDVMMQENPDFYQLIYNLKGNSTAQASFFVGLCPFKADSENNQTDSWNNLIENNSKTYLNTVSDLQINCFDYQSALHAWNISYVALSDFDAIPRFSNDPTFTLVFKNNQVAIFKVVKG